MTNMRRIPLSSDDLRSLREISFLDPLLAKTVAKWIAVDDADAYNIPAEVCEEVRSSLTYILAASGFDENFEPNERGKKLEELIDRFAEG